MKDIKIQNLKHKYKQLIKHKNGQSNKITSSQKEKNTQGRPKDVRTTCTSVLCNH